MLKFSFFRKMNIMNEIVMSENLEIGVLDIILLFLVQQIWHFIYLWQPF